MSGKIIKFGMSSILSFTLLFSGCDSGETDDGASSGGKQTGGQSKTGGSTSTGGQTGSSGGVTSQGGSSGGATSKGGSTSGGASNQGGATAGATSKGGSISGGATSQGGASAGATSQGGSNGGTTGQGGTSGGATGQGGSSGGASGGATSQGGSTGSTGGQAGGSTTPVDSKVDFKPRIIASTDGEKDDRSTMVRFLMYTSDYDVAGIVQNMSRYQKNGHSKEGWVEKEIGLYNQTLGNLRKHNPDFPDASKLSAVVKVGNENSGDIGTKSPADYKTKDTPGSQLMIDTLLDNDPRPVHIPSWGGAATTAYAFYKLKMSYKPEELKKAADKVWIYCIWYQDAGGQWIEDNIPEARIYEAYKWDNVWDYQSLSGPSPADVKAYMTESWFKANVGVGHGPLGEYAYQNQSYVSEGDTPAFLTVINNGLRQHMDYSWGGWGGRPVFDKGRHMTDGKDDGNEHKPYWRWMIALEKDFAARMDWAVASDFKNANHNPKAKVVGDLHRSVAGGEKVELDASPTTDPDGNKLTFKWWQYVEAGTASAVTIAGDTEQKGASFTVPSEPGKTIHIILEVTDDGTPDLKNWQRIIFTIK